MCGVGGWVGGVGLVGRVGLVGWLVALIGWQHWTVDPRATHALRVVGGDEEPADHGVRLDAYRR